MRGRLLSPMLVVVLLLAGSERPGARVPYLERFDYSFLLPFVAQDPEQSIAAYAWLRSPTDIDVYTFEVTEPARLYGNVLVPVCPAYETFYVSFALIGPGLPEPEWPLPFTLPAGYGAIVVPWLPDGQPRPTMYEPFGAKWYYQGPELRFDATAPGRYAFVYWQPDGRVGDYVAAIGDREIFDGPAIIRALINTPIIRRDGELHVECPQ